MSTQTTPQGCSNFKLRQMTRKVSQYYDLEMHKIGLKTTQYSLLSHVQKLGPVRPGALAEAMSMDASTLTRNLKPLVEAGLVTISAGSDARSRSVALTEAGREKRNEAQKRWKAAQHGLTELLGTERVLALHLLIDESLALLAHQDAGAEHE